MWIYEQTMTNLANSVWSPHQTDLLRCYWNLMDGYIIYFVIYPYQTYPSHTEIKFWNITCVLILLLQMFEFFSIHLSDVTFENIWKIPQPLSRTVPRASIKFIKFFLCWEVYFPRQTWILIVFSHYLSPMWAAHEKFFSPSLHTLLELKIPKPLQTFLPSTKH